jgi:MFS family permease
MEPFDEQSDRKAKRMRQAGMSSFFPQPRGLSFGISLTMLLVAFAALAVDPIMPIAVRDLGGLALYGWTFSAVTLGMIVGIVITGYAADRYGPALPYTVALTLFGSSLIVCGLAPTMWLLLGGRLCAGLGGGALGTLAWFCIGRGYPKEVQARMGAFISSAWIVPSLLGPGLAGVVTQVLTWRVVFFGLVPFVLMAACLMLPALATMKPLATGTTMPQQVATAIVLATGVGMMLAGLGTETIALAVLLSVIGLILAGPALWLILPAGTLSIHKGVPAAVALRAAIAFAFLGTQAFLPLALIAVRYLTTTLAGLMLATGSLGWVAGAWLQARFDERHGARIHHRLTLSGSMLLLLGIAGSTTVLLASVPVLIAVISWGMAGAGIGLVYNTASIIVIQSAGKGEEGAASSSLEISDALGSALGTGLGGTAIAFGIRAHWPMAAGIGVAFLFMVVISFLTIGIARRL